MDDMTNFQRNFSTGEVEIEWQHPLSQDRIPRAARSLRVLSRNAPVAGFDTDRETFFGLYNGMHEPQVVAGG